jgi:hypothetical protein
MYIKRKTSGAAGNSLYTTIIYTRGAARIGLGTTAKYLRRTTSGAAGNGLGTMIKCLANLTRAWVTGQQLGQGPHTQKLGTISVEPPVNCSGFCS